MDKISSLNISSRMWEFLAAELFSLLGIFGQVVGKATAIATEAVVSVWILSHTILGPISNKLTPVISTNICPFTRHITDNNFHSRHVSSVSFQETVLSSVLQWEALGCDLSWQRTKAESNPAAHPSSCKSALSTDKRTQYLIKISIDCNSYSSVSKAGGWFVCLLVVCCCWGVFWRWR